MEFLVDIKYKNIYGIEIVCGVDDGGNKNNGISHN